MAKFCLGQVEAKVRVEFGPLVFWSKLLIAAALATFAQTRSLWPRPLSTPGLQLSSC